MSSGVALTMVVIVGISTLMRRGWRIAAFQTVPLGVLFLAWWLAYATDRYQNARGTLSRRQIHGDRCLRNAFGRAGVLPGVGLTLAAVLVVGLVLAWAPLSREDLRRSAAMPFAMLVGVVVFLTIAGVGERASLLGANFATRPRYVHIIVALIAPALAVAAQGIASRWRYQTPILVVLLLVGVPHNVGLLWPHHNPEVPLTTAQMWSAIRGLFHTMRKFAAPHAAPSRASPVHGGGPQIDHGRLVA